MAGGTATDAEIGTITLPWSTTISTPADLLNRIGNWLLGIMAPLCVIGIVYSGFLYITGAQGGAGDKKVMMAKKSLIWTITGIVVTLLSMIIIRNVEWYLH